MKILLASIPVPGHLNPLLAVGNILKRDGHEVLVQSLPSFKSSVEAAGLRFIPSPPGGAIGVEQFLAEFPDRQSVPPGLEMFSFDVQNYFAPHIPAEAEGLKAAMKDFPADFILTDSFYWGTLPLLLGARENRPVIAHLGISILNLGSGKNTPSRPGASKDERLQEAEKRERLLLKPAQMAVDAALAKAGSPPLPCPALEAMSTLPDFYLHPGIRSFEYPDSSHSASPVHYIGPLPLPPSQSEIPAWWPDIDRKKKLVLVTQGTVANRDLGQLIGPALTALAEEEGLIVLATTGGQPLEAIPADIPSNARVAAFLPFQQILPHIDLLITNGGYGTVNMALAHGIPIISAGMTEDKEEVSEHVQWSGAGIDLKTNQATPESLLTAVKAIFANPAYRKRAKELAMEFSSHDTERELIELIEAHVYPLINV